MDARRMPRTARIVIPGYPHHVTQRGNRRLQTFFSDSDYATYLRLLGDNLARVQAEIWAYCLMPNHVHLIIVPRYEVELSKLLGNTHHRYARLINAANGWQGHLWQERFHSFVMDEQHLLGAVRYVELNPVRAGLCASADEWRWSSVHAHRQGQDDDIVTVAPMLDRVANWDTYLAQDNAPEISESLRTHSNTGRPAGSPEFIRQLEGKTNRRLLPRKPGPKPSN
jgi:putative transposase